MDGLKTRQDQDFTNENLEKGKKQYIYNWYLANQEGNKNIKMREIENIKLFLLFSVILQMILKQNKLNTNQIMVFLPAYC
jgi:hypothetical protein